MTKKEKIISLLKKHSITIVAKKLNISVRGLYNALERLEIPNVGRKGRSGRKSKI